jgi:hypothetical protein
MQRRQFVTSTVTAVALAAVPSLVHAANRKFVFKIKTKSGGIVGNSQLNGIGARRELALAISCIARKEPCNDRN